MAGTGCDAVACGTCTVLVDGRRVNVVRNPSTVAVPVNADIPGDIRSDEDLRERRRTAVGTRYGDTRGDRTGAEDVELDATRAPWPVRR